MKAVTVSHRINKSPYHELGLVVRLPDSDMQKLRCTRVSTSTMTLMIRFAPMKAQALRTPSHRQLDTLSDQDLIELRHSIEKEVRRRGLKLTVGHIGEQLVVTHFNETPGLPKLQIAPSGTKNVDALSRAGDRYTIKTVLDENVRFTLIGITPISSYLSFC